MVKELIELFSSAKDMEKIVLDNYIPKNGLYFFVDRQGHMKPPLLIKRREITKTERYNWFCRADYYSQLIDMNKPVDKNKKIHSNNIYSFFLKASLLPGMGEKDKELTMEEIRQAVNRYYDILSEENQDKEAKRILGTVNLEPLDQEEANRNRLFLLEHLNEILISIESAAREEKEFSNKEYIKIFFEAPFEKYEQEYLRYTLPKIFNNNGANVEINGEIWGLSNDNMGLNSKKPFLECKSTKFKVPFRLSLKEALISKRVFEWLNFYSDEEGGYRKELPIPFNYDFKGSVYDDKPYLYFYKEQENGKTIIKDFDVVPHEVKLKEKFRYENYLEMNKFEETDITDMKQLEKRVDESFYFQKLIYSYYNDDIKPKAGVISADQINILFMSRKAMQDFFRKGQDEGICSCIDKVTLQLVADKFIGKDNFSMYDIGKSLNLRWNLLRYFKIGGKETMGDKVGELRQILKEKMVSDIYAGLANDEEFYFACGQLGTYLALQSEAKNQAHDVYESYFYTNNGERLKKILKDAYLTYNHKIFINYKRVNSLIAMIMGYDTESKVNTDLLLAGLSAPNILMEKTEKSGGNDNGDEK